MTAAELIVKIQADIHDLAAKLTEAGVMVHGFADDVESSNRRSSSAFKDTERSMNDLERASQTVRNSMNGHGPGLWGALGDVIGGVLKLGGVVENAATDMGQWMQQTDQGATAMTGFGAALAESAPILGYVAVGIAALVATLMIIPIVAGAGIFVLQLLANVVGTVGFFFYAALGPVGIFVGLLGLLGAGFVLSAEKAMKGVGVFHEFGGEVSRLGGMFGHLITLLGIDFMPIFQKLVDAARQAILYFDRLAKMPLADAMHSLATTGMQMLTKFLYAVGHALAQPFRLAVQLAFGGPGGRAENDVHGLLNSLGGFLFGTTGTATVHRGAAKGAVVNQGSITGALEPIKKWFDNLNLTKDGKRWGHEIMIGIEESGIGSGLLKYFVAQLADAGLAGAKAFIHAQVWVIYTAIPAILKFLLSHFVSVFTAIGNFGIRELTGLWDWVKFEAGAAWDWIKSKATAIWNTIVSFIERPLHVSISWPSPPGWVSSLLGKGLSLGGGITGFLASHTAAGGIFTRPQTRLIGESGAEAVIPLTGGMGRHVLGMMGGGGGGVTVVVTGNTFLSGGRPAARELARTLKPELDRIVRVGR